MIYRMFIDDERMPVMKPLDTTPWIIVRTFEAFQAAVEYWGFPGFISFDHDLGETEPTGCDIAHWIVESDLNSGGALIPDGWSFYVHSQNPVGAENIRALLDNYLTHKTQVEKIVKATE